MRPQRRAAAAGGASGRPGARSPRGAPPAAPSPSAWREGAAPGARPLPSNEAALPAREGGARGKARCDWRCRRHVTGAVRARVAAAAVPLLLTVRGSRGAAPWVFAVAFSRALLAELAAWQRRPRALGTPTAPARCPQWVLQRLYGVKPQPARPEGTPACVSVGRGRQRIRCRLGLSVLRKARVGY